MELAGNSKGKPYTAFLEQLWGGYGRRLKSDLGQRPGPPGSGDAVIPGYRGLNLCSW